MTDSPGRRRRLAGLYVVVSILVLVAGCSGNSGVAVTTAGEIINQDKRLSAGDLHGDLLTVPGAYSLSNDLGHVVLLNFFASWCGPCQAETPQIEALHQELPPSASIRIIGVDTKDFTQSRSRAWLTANKVSFPVIWDQPGKLILELGHVTVPGLPFTILIDKEGKVAAFYVGQVFPADLLPALERLNQEPSTK